MEDIVNLRMLGMFALKRDVAVFASKGGKFTILPVEGFDNVMCNVHSVRELFRAANGSGKIFLPAEKVETV